MTTLDLIAALIAAMARDDTRRTSALLAELEARLSPDELADWLDVILVEDPPAQRQPGRPPCA